MDHVINNEYQRLSPFFMAHAVYNLIWGAFVIFTPRAYFRIVGIKSPLYLPFWQTIGMFVLIYVPGYIWIARDPQENYRLVIIAALGTLFGPVGFIFSVFTGNLPLAFGYTIITNDLIWIPLFSRYLYLFFKDGGLSKLKL